MRYLIIILHKDHKTYYSADPDNYTSFSLWKSTADLGAREFAQSYFKEKYNLDISVRPPHKKEYVEKIPYVVCYAQIQKWQHSFGEFSDIKKEDINNITPS